MAEFKHTNYTIITICFTVILFAFLFSGCAKKTGVTAQKSANAKEQRTVSEDKELERMEQEIQDSPFLITAEYFRKTAGKGDNIKLFGPTKKDKELEERLLRLEQRMKGLPYRTKDSNGMPVLRRKVVLLSLLGDLGLEVLTRLPQALRSTDGVIPVDTSRLSRLLESQGLSVGDLVKTSVRREVANLAGIQAYILVSFPSGKPIQGKKSLLRIDVIHAVESVLIGSYLATIDDFDKVAPKISRDIVQATEWSCRIIKIDENSIYLNAGRLSGVQPGDRFQVYGKGAEIFDPVTKRSLGFAPGNFKGVIEVETLFGSDASRAKIISGGGFKVGDQVKILELS
ncbi:hypothetical protein DBT_2241 [Dissulfuribacter thermophilus]|uniref:Uncharacterized protein n=1 Tax=Dissulfuribacter thermophilus TaxID=1156395 RepID=A0A1B9F351_9BACT|nr:hypothetical protein [Dissulfuribacter thermophilus]OCC14368.1 hypothetical protein DBT_2241 [Dissulfuribacter thermophilus]